MRERSSSLMSVELRRAQGLCGSWGYRWKRCTQPWVTILMTLVLLGCATEQEKADAITEINRIYGEEYQQILTENGTRSVDATPEQAFLAMRSSLMKLDMTIATSDSDSGYINAYATAPLPLSPEEWKRAAKIELPRLRKIVVENVGLIGWFIQFEPEGLDIVLNVLIVDKSPGAEVSVTMRMRETAPPKSGFPRREYAPPAAVRIGLDKIWAAFGSELPGSG